jgi:hypothetical protein
MAHPVSSAIHVPTSQPLQRAGIVCLCLSAVFVAMFATTDAPDNSAMLLIPAIALAPSGALLLIAARLERRMKWLFVSIAAVWIPVSLYWLEVIFRILDAAFR